MGMQFYANKFDSLKEMDQFLKTVNYQTQSVENRQFKCLYNLKGNWIKKITVVLLQNSTKHLKNSHQF